MDAIRLLAAQLDNINTIVRDVIGQIPDGAWTQRPHDGANPPGFVAWHLPATRDWALHTAIQGVPQVREREPFASSPVNQPHPPFGMALEAADAIARSVTRADAIAYVDATQQSMASFLASLTGDALDRVPDIRAMSFRLPMHAAPGYVEEVESMAGYPVWALLSGPCIGHAREHIGALLTALECLKAR